MRHDFTSTAGGRTRLICRTLLAGMLTGLLAACQTGGSDTPGPAPAPQEAVSATRVSPGPSIADAYYVTEFVLADVLRTRALPRFAAQFLSASYTFSGNPQLAGRTIAQNAFEAIRLEYALSVGLTGVGQTVAINDTSVDLTHPEFAGTPTILAGTATPDQFHGTAVASVLLGGAGSGDIMGVAPGASLFVGQMDFSSGVSFSTLAGYFDEARRIGAIASSNSWNFVSSTYATTDYSRYLSGGRGRFLTALRNYAQNGVVIFGLQNDFNATSVNELNGLPIAFPDLEPTWIAGMSAVPTLQDGRIVSALRQSAPCNEAARFCIAANGTVRAASTTAEGGYAVVSGTSFVVPQIAGAIALLAEAFPNMNAAQLRDRLLATADNSWFTPEGWVEFAPGLVHGYNSEFGHGFIDLRAALLPIGQINVPIENAPAQPVSTPIVVGGGASGDAMVQALSAQRVLVTDALGGAFSTPALSLTAQLPRIPDDEDQLWRAMALDQRAVLATRQAALSGRASALVPAAATLMPAHASVADFAGLDRVDIPLAFSADATSTAASKADMGEATWLLRAYAPRDDSESAGLGVVRRASFGPLGVEVGLAMARSDGSMLGIYVPGAAERMHADTLSLQAGLGWRLGPRLSLRARSEWGLADGPGAGVIDGFESVEFSAHEIGIDARGIFGRDDVLGLSARQPLAITGGTADLRLATGLAAGGGVTFSSVPVALSPNDRQFDLALDYIAPLGAATSLGVGLRQSWNFGHVAGERATNAVVVLQRQF